MVQTGALLGDVSDVGYFEVPISIGAPAQEFSLIVDTGSVVTAVPCVGCDQCSAGAPREHAEYSGSKSSTRRKLDCRDDACPTTTRASGGGFNRCGKLEAGRRTPCLMEQRYTEGSRISGEYESDVVCIGGGSACVDAPARLAFGCATSMTRLFRSQRADGILGLGRHSQTLVSALAAQHRGARDAFAVCLGRASGELTLGGLGGAPDADVAWTPLVAGSAPTQYSVALER